MILITDPSLCHDTTAIHFVEFQILSIDPREVILSGIVTIKKVLSAHDQ